MPCAARAAFAAYAVGSLLLVGVGFGAPPAGAVEIGQQDDFESGTPEDWVMALQGATPQFPPIAIPNAGPDGNGDFALEVRATGAVVGPGGRLVVNTVAPRWQGSYTAAFVTGLMFDVRNPNAFPLTLRVGLDGPEVGTTGGRWLTQGVVVPASSGWQTLTFSLMPPDLVPGNAESTSASVTRSNVGVLRILHAPIADWTSTPIEGTLLLDDIEALPEPGMGAGLAAGVLATIAWAGRMRATDRGER